jgi:hypothetical protein
MLVPMGLTIFTAAMSVALLAEEKTHIAKTSFAALLVAAGGTVVCMLLIALTRYWSRPESLKDRILTVLTRYGSTVGLSLEEVMEEARAEDPYSVAFLLAEMTKEGLIAQSMVVYSRVKGNQEIGRFTDMHEIPNEIWDLFGAKMEDVVPDMINVRFHLKGPLPAGQPLRSLYEAKRGLR